MTITEIIKNRNIEEVLHFTTFNGMLGILGCKRLLSRERLPKEKSLSHILKLNTPKVKDRGWEDYVNMSISNINSTLLDISIRNWHQDARWVIIAFDTEIMTHDDVVFTTTNNAHYSSVVRGKGPAGLEKLFADQVTVYKGFNQTGPAVRGANHRLCDPTCPQAEVMYPGEVSNDYIKRIYCMSEEDTDELEAFYAAEMHRRIELIVDESKFDGFRG